MSLSVVSVLAKNGRIDQARLAQSLAHRYNYDRAYGPSMHRVLARIRDGEPRKDVATSSFGGQGSYGNGAPMRAAPLGAFFADDLAKVAEQAALSAEVTHAHPEGIAGAVAVAVASAQACRYRAEGRRPTHSDFIAALVEQLPQNEVRSKLVRARSMSQVSSPEYPIAVLGNGIDMSAQDTVPYAMWCCGQALEDYPRALCLAVTAGGDRDTICAIVGGVVASYVGAEGIPSTGWSVGRRCRGGICDSMGQRGNVLRRAGHRRLRRSDTRANLRCHFEADRYYIAHAAITALAAECKMTGKDAARAIKQYRCGGSESVGV